MTRDEMRSAVLRICENREYDQCWFASDRDQADCGNWPHCAKDCPLRMLRDEFGIVPQEDGGLDKQPAVSAEQNAAGQPNQPNRGDRG